MRWDDFFPTFICTFFQVGWGNWGLDRMIFVLPFWTWNCTSDPISLAGENSNFINLATLWNQKRECFRTCISDQKSNHAKYFLRSAALKLLEMSWRYCCAGLRTLEKPLFVDITFINFVCLLEWIHVQILF